eukprot:gene7302-9850_t
MHLANAPATLITTDGLAAAAMWVIVHMTYAERVDLTGQPLPADAFKATPEGHTGGSLNVAPAYVGYLAANLLTAQTRGWLLGQGHCVAAIEAANCLVDNLSPAQQGRYAADSAGLSRLCSDFYSYRIDAAGQSAVPLGSHVNAHTAGGVSEGGYLGFAETQYVHMPLPGEALVAILSDGAFEEQRGSDWSERWWRAEDCGSVTPVMILHGDDDQIVPIADSAMLSSKIIKQATLKVYPGAPHGLFATHKKQFNEDLLNFIRAVTGLVERQHLGPGSRQALSHLVQGLSATIRNHRAGAGT